MKHKCPACRHGHNETLNDALLLGNEYLKSYNNGYAAGYKDILIDFEEAAIDAHSFAYLSFAGDSHEKEWLDCLHPTCSSRRMSITARRT